MNPIFMNGRLGVYARTAPIEKWTSTSEGMSIDHDVYVRNCEFFTPTDL